MTMLAGEGNILAKLTVEDVEFILQAQYEGTMSQHELAKKFGVSQSCICLINTGQTWNSVYRKFHQVE